MAAVQKASRDYVVGGPVQPGRSCYVTREADDVLFERLTGSEFCHVLAPPDTGKSSLVANVSFRLRKQGIAVASVDLAQISSRDVEEDVGRWYYSFAYRVVRELRIRADMQGWWKERAGLTNLQRLREFFLDVVLTEISGPVVVLVDRIEAVLGIEVSRALFAAIRACYDARATEPDSRRLTFALLGCEPVGGTVPLGHDSPFGVSTAIALPDFDLDGVLRLARCQEHDSTVAGEIARRVWHWTAGHPYLSQKILRALSRRRCHDPEAVDDVVAALFLGPNTIREEPHFALVARELLKPGRTRIARLSLYGRICKGGSVKADPASSIQRDLLHAGVVKVSADNRLIQRNRIYAEIFSAYWVNQNLPFSWRALAVAVIGVLALFLLPIWYTQYLPEPYVRALKSEQTEFPDALKAWERLSFFPGFGDTADRLFAEYLAGASRRARRLAEVERYGDYLARLPGQADLQNELNAELWDRKAVMALQRGDRDAGILFALKALQHPTLRRKRRLGELLGEDFASLVGTIRPGAPVEALGLDTATKRVTVLDRNNRLSTWEFGVSGVRRIGVFELLAEEVVPLQARATYSGRNRGRRLSLIVRTDHARPRDIMIELRAPTGRTARVSLGAGSAGEYHFDSRRDKALRTLLDENPNGTWMIYFTDMAQGVRGSIQGWSLAIDGRLAKPAGSPLLPAVIPEPRVVQQARASLDSGGALALSWPESPAVRGDILVWDTATQELLSRIPRPAGFRTARFALDGAGILVVTVRGVELWDTRKNELSLSVPVDPAFEPVLSNNGRYLIVDSVADGNQGGALTVWDLSARREHGHLVTGDTAPLAVVDSSGHYLAVSDGDRLVRVWSLPGGELAGEFEHASMPVAIHFDASGRWMVTSDADNTLRLWDMQVAHDLPVLVRGSSAPWAIRFGEGQLVFGSLDRGFEVIGLAGGSRQGPVLRHGSPAPRSASVPSAGELLFADSAAVTSDGRQTIRIWRIPAAVSAGSKRVAAASVSALAAVGPRARRLALATGTGSLRVLAGGQRLAASSLPSQAGDEAFRQADPITRIVFDETGQTIATGTLHGVLRLWDAGTGLPRDFESRIGSSAVVDIRFASDSSWVAVSTHQSLQIVDTDDGALLARLPVMGESLQLALTNTGSGILIAGDRSGLTLWDWRQDVTKTLLDDGPEIRRVAVSPVGSVIATVDVSRRIALWDENMQRLSRRARIAAAADWLEFTADGTALVVQAGVWLYRFQVSADGLRPQWVRLLPESPDASWFDRKSGELFVLDRSRRSVPLVERLQPGEPIGTPIEGAPESLRARIERALALTLDEWGEPKPLQPL